MSGSSGLGTRSIAQDTSASLGAADNQNISSLLSGSAWNSTIITYSFPTSSSVYGTQTSYGDPAPFNGFSALTAQQRGEVLRAFSLISSYTTLTFTQITETTSTHAAIRLANSSSPPTAYAYYPATSVRGGDVFYGRTGQNPVMGNFDSGQATLHEIGHALGLKHGQETGTYGAMNANRLDIEFSLMNYPNYIGSAEGYATASTSSQTYMMYDIAALQYMYGANFNQAGHSNTYTWSSTTGAELINGVSQGTPVNNHIFSTIWTAGATSTYDLSNFSQNQVDDMEPGAWMLFSSSQLADLNASAPSKPSGEIFARGDIYNALQYNGDSRSLITNIITGSGADIVTGNAADNTIRGNAGNDSLNGLGGNDVLDGGTGNDTLTGGTGADTFVYGVGYAADTVTDFSHADGDRVDLTAFASVHSFLQVSSRDSQVNGDTVINFGSGDSLTLKNVSKAALVAGDFVFLAVQTIESYGSTSPAQVGSFYFLDSSDGSSGPELLFGGAPVTAGQFGSWVPIGAEQAAGGYEVAWKVPGADQYTEWTTDSIGNFLSNPTGVVSGSSLALEMLEPSFHQDLNSDGTLGPVSATIESSGSTSLAQIGGSYFLYPFVGSPGLQLRFGGAPVTAGQFGAWAPIGAEQVANGIYQVAWKNGGADQYLAWNVDSNGNYLSQGPAVAGGTWYVENFESILHQDLNGDATIGPTTSTIEAIGATSLTKVADSYFFNYASGGPQLKMKGLYVAANQFGNWTPLGAEQAANGVYQVAWKNGGFDQYLAWNVDSNGNYLSQGPVVAGGTWYAENFESILHQDFNADGQIGFTTSTIEAVGATSLTKVADSYFFNYASGGPQLKMNGQYVAAGQFGNWTPLGAERAANGIYQVAWKNGALDQYLAWNVDSNGNYLSQGPAVAGATWYVENFESILHQNLNGDGQIGPTSSTIEAVGATSLTKVADSYFFNYASGGPQLKMNGQYVAAGQFGNWTPIGAEQAANGIYQVAWKNGGFDQYLAWNVDSNGNYLSQSPVVAGATWYVENFESILHQDLNADGTIGPTTSTIEAIGATSLTKVADSYFFNYASGGPQLKMNGQYVAAGQFGAWTPIGVEAAGAGYWVAWKNGGADQYIVWETDGGGNFLRYMINPVSGSTSALQQFEPTFHQDLNGDGVIPIEAVGVTKLVQSGNNFVLDPMASLGGPLLKYNGANVTVNEFGTNWTPIGADQTPTGYRVAWYGGSDQYTVWDTDTAGNYVRNVVGVVSGGSADLQGLEPSLQQDLNRDGVIPAVNTIESFGVTSLLQIGNAYLLGSIYGPELKQNGVAVNASQLGSWTAIGAEQVGSGYDVCFKAGNADLYMVWSTDSNGNYLSSILNLVSGSNPGLEALEPVFHQDLNRDGILGVAGLKINLEFDALAMAAPQSFRDGMQAAANILQAAFLDPITINIAVGYGEYNGQALPSQTGAEGGFDSGQTVSYATLRNALAGDETSGDDAIAVNSLPGGSSLQGHSSFLVANGEAKALGLLAGNGAALDGRVGIGRNIFGNNLISVALHELTHAMGRLAGTALDLFRFNENGSGNHVFGPAIPATPAYFSINGGSQDLADFGINSDPGDLLNTGVQGPNDPFNEFYSGNTIVNLTQLDLRMMDVLGYNRNLGFAGSANASSDVSASSSAGGTLTMANWTMLSPGSDGSGTPNIALLTNYMASAFPGSAGLTSGTDPAQGLSSQPFLTNPITA